MVFNSLVFMVFFAVVLFLHSLPLNWSFKKFQLLVASYLFYAAWNPPFVLLLILSAVVDFYLARAIAKSRSNNSRRLLLITSLILNLGLLSYFKYGDFVLESFSSLLGLVGVTYQAPASDIVLPLGISFYTFETISYLCDVYRGRIKPWNSFLDYALFLTFFPHLVAGPIVRAADFLPQCRYPRRATPAQMGWGLTLLVLGLCEKVILADHFLAPTVDQIFASSDHIGLAEGWLGTFAFSGQIFFDFAGYSTCAIGVALCFGFVLNDNFHFPYGAVGFSDFWQRWHMSLSSWLRDYLYISLGGNRRGQVRTYVNLMVTMLLGGLWHGAAWRFVVWGALHGTYLIGERFATFLLGAQSWYKRGFFQWLLALATFALVSTSWVFFRAGSFEQAFHMLRVMSGTSPSLQFFAPSLWEGKKTVFGLALVVVIIMVSVHWTFRNTTLEGIAQRVPWWLRSLVVAGMVFCLVITQGENRAFIYFQF